MARNPFSRTVTTKGDDIAALRQAAADKVLRENPPPASPIGPAVSGAAAAAGTLVREKDDELQQVSSDSDGGHAEDTPGVLRDNEGKETTGLDFGDFERLEKVVDAPDDGSEQGVEKGPRSRADELGIGGTAGGSGLEFASGQIQDELAAASGNQSPGIDLTGELSVAAAQAAKTGGESLFDLQTQSGDLAIAQAGATETSPSVAIEWGDIDNAVAGAAALLGVATQLGGGPVTGVPAVGLAAFAGVRKIDEGLSLGDAVIEGLIAPAEKAAASNLERQLEIDKAAIAEKRAAEEAAKKAAEEAAKKKAEEDAAAKKKEEEEELPDGSADSIPNPDAPVRSKEQFVLDQKIKAELGYVHFPGDIDPVDGDGTTGGTPLANGGSALHQQGKEGLIGNPVSTGAGQPSGGAGSGSPGFGGSDQGGDIDFEDRPGFTGGTRTEDLPNFDVGGAPLVGLPPPEEEEEDTSAASPFSFFRQRGGKDSDDND